MAFDFGQTILGETRYDIQRPFCVFMCVLFCSIHSLHLVFLSCHYKMNFRSFSFQDDSAILALLGVVGRQCSNSLSYYAINSFTCHSYLAFNSGTFYILFQVNILQANIPRNIIQNHMKPTNSSPHLRPPFLPFPPFPPHPPWRFACKTAPAAARHSSPLRHPSPRWAGRTLRSNALGSGCCYNV